MGPRALVCAAALALVACGDSAVNVPQAAATPLLAADISVQQTGDAPVKIVPGSVHWSIDDAHLLNVTLRVHSNAKSAQTVSGRASLSDKAGKLVGDATGGVLNVQPNQDVDLKLSGPTPNGTVTSASFEFTTIPASTPISR
jgi:hypothetical protein